MDFATIINLLLPYWGIIAVALGFGGYFLFQKDSAKKIILSLIIRIEKEAEKLALNTGEDKFKFLVDKGYALLPAPARIFITQNMFETLAQNLYNTAKNYLIVAKPVTLVVSPVIPVIQELPVSIVVIPDASTTISNGVALITNTISQTVEQSALLVAEQTRQKMIQDVTEAINKSLTPVVAGEITESIQPTPAPAQTPETTPQVQ